MRLMSEEEKEIEGGFDLSFEPTWVSEPVNPYINKEYKSTPQRGNRNRGQGGQRGGRDNRGGGRDQRGGGRDNRGGGRDARGGGRDNRGGQDKRGDRRDERGASRPSSHSAPVSTGPQLALDIAFIPERDNLASLIKRIISSGRAYSMFQIAKLVLSKPEFHAVKVTLNTPEKAEDAPQIFACQNCRMVHTEQSTATAHAMHCATELYYNVEEEEGEPPKGNFSCVVRCRLSGTLLGPPNYHGYNDRFRELHQQRFSNMSVDDYRNKLETCHDEALVEQWKAETCKQVVYVVKGTPEGEDVRFARRTDMEAHFRSNHLAGVIKGGTRFIMPGTVSLKTESEDLRRDVRGAWGKENKFPMKLSIALSAAFKHSRLHVFKTADGNRYVTPILPTAMDPDAQTVPEMSAILEHLAEHPKSNRDGLFDAIVVEGGPTADALKAALKMLVDRGNVVAYSDGSFTLPPARKPRPPQKKKKHKKPAPPKAESEVVESAVDTAPEASTPAEPTHTEKPSAPEAAVTKTAAPETPAPESSVSEPSAPKAPTASDASAPEPSPEAPTDPAPSAPDASS